MLDTLTAKIIDLGLMYKDERDAKHPEPKIVSLTQIEPENSRYSKEIKESVRALDHEDLLEMLKRMYIGRSLYSREFGWNQQDEVRAEEKHLDTIFGNEVDSIIASKILEKSPANLARYYAAWNNREWYIKPDKVSSEI